MRRRPSRLTLAAVAVALPLLVTGCSSDDDPIRPENGTGVDRETEVEDDDGAEGDNSGDAEDDDPDEG